jgi:putative DNA primase/helicase
MSEVQLDYEVDAKQSKKTKKVKKTTSESPNQRTDMHNAESMVARHRDKLRYTDTDGWLCWNGKVWERSEHAAFACAVETVKSFIDIASQIEDDDKRKKALREAADAQATHRINAMMTQAKHHPALLDKIENFDTDPDLINVQNGVLDLRTGELLPHHPRYKMTRITNVKYNPDAECPVWENHLEMVQSDPRMRAYIQRLSGYSLTGRTSEKILSMFSGGHDTGKTTTLESIRHSLGDYASVISASSLIIDPSGNGGDRPRSDLVSLQGARFAIAAEMESGQKLASALAKLISGSDTIKVRTLYKEPINLIPQFDAEDEALWRRIKVVPFMHHIPLEDQDVYIMDKLRAEAEGIFAWCVRGSLDWREGGMRYPQEVLEATGLYRKEMSTFETCSDECFIFGETYSAPLDQCFIKYTSWCAKNNKRAETRPAFSKWLKEKRGVTGKRESSGTILFGIGMLG